MVRVGDPQAPPLQSPGARTGTRTRHLQPTNLGDTLSARTESEISVRSVSAVTGFVDRLAAFAEAPALLNGDEVLSYAELDARVDAAAERLGAERR
jgi:hypothetical protein